MKRWVAAFQLIGVGFYLGLSIVLGVVFGIWIDRKLDTGFIFALIGLGAGLIVGVYGVYRMVSQAVESDRRGDTEKD